MIRRIARKRFPKRSKKKQVPSLLTIVLFVYFCFFNAVVVVFATLDLFLVKKV